ncbi:hypothetical protein [Pseudorhodobacter sp.]|nr:hypothetical protein [Pseudorhodobacter sp.]MDN5789025.1 hypothetical protein [Pseudorhodobacter sp.]
MTTFARALNWLAFTVKTSVRDRAALIAHRNIWLGKQDRVIATPACFYSY